MCALQCTRRAVLNELAGFSGASVAAMHGNMLHDLFEMATTTQVFSGVAFEESIGAGPHSMDYSPTRWP